MIFFLPVFGTFALQNFGRHFRRSNLEAEQNGIAKGLGNLDISGDGLVRSLRRHLGNCGFEKCVFLNCFRGKSQVV